MLQIGCRKAKIGRNCQETFICLQLRKHFYCELSDEVAERLRRQAANLMGSARMSSNLILVEIFRTFHFIYILLKLIGIEWHARKSK